MNGYVGDTKGNICTVMQFGSLEAAQKALDSLIDCTYCINCEGCMDCVNCSNCEECADCKDCDECIDCIGGAALVGRYGFRNA